MSSIIVYIVKWKHSLNSTNLPMNSRLLYLYNNVESCLLRTLLFRGPFNAFLLCPIKLFYTTVVFQCCLFSSDDVNRIQTSFNKSTFYYPTYTNLFYHYYQTHKVFNKSIFSYLPKVWYATNVAREVVEVKVITFDCV